MATIAALLQYGQWLMLILGISVIGSKYAVPVFIRSILTKGNSNSNGEWLNQRGKFDDLLTERDGSHSGANQL